MKFLEVLVFLIYAGWLVLSMLAQGETWINERIKRKDLFNLIPDYKFFCPDPTTQDFHLYYRKQNHDETWSEWEELSIGKRHPFWCFIWNPGKKGRKVLQKMVRTIKKHYPKEKGKPNGPIYNLLLNYLRNLPSTQHQKAIQFKFTSKQNLHPGSDEKQLFLSRVHPLKQSRLYVPVDR